ncbi:MAG: dipeptide epimerase [Candidatus Parvarchaeota archaeon]
MISSIEFKQIKIAMKKPFVIATGSTSVYEGYLIRVKTDDGYEGVGEAVPTPHITGDTMGSIQDELRIFAKELVGMEISPERINEKMILSARGSKASRAGIDMAIWDIVGKRANLPLHSILGGYRTDFETSYTVDLVEPELAAKEAQDLLKEGVTIFKIKLGSGIDKDYSRVETVRRIVGEDKQIYVDFNQSYTAKKAISLSEKIAKFNIEFLEQPVPAKDITSLKFVRDRSSIPVMADEAVMSPQDAAAVIYHEAADLINVKLMKSGGITDALTILKTSQAFGIPTMIGCMVETRLANTAGLQLALSQPSVKYTDLDGFSSLKDDIVTGGIVFKNGRNSLIDGPGLGVKINKGY